MPWRCINALEKALELSSCAAALVGPKIFRPWARNSSTTPAAKGASGPTTVSPTFSACAHSRNATTSEIAKFSSLPPASAVPPLPGATNTLVALGDCASFHASACSRPPPPITSIFIILRCDKRFVRRLGLPECPAAFACARHHRLLRQWCFPRAWLPRPSRASGLRLPGLFLRLQRDRKSVV